MSSTLQVLGKKQTNQSSRFVISRSPVRIRATASSSCPASPSTPEDPDHPHPPAPNAGRHGIDPYADLLGLENDPTFVALMGRYLAEETPLKAANTQRQDHLYSRILSAAWPAIEIADLTPRRVAQLHRDLTLERGPTIANRILSLVSQVCELAERDDLRPAQSNPTKAVRRNTEPRRTNFLSRAQRATFLQAATDQLVRGKIPRNAWTLICLMLLTGLRWSEARSLCWEEVDLERGVVRLFPRGEKRTENKGTHQRTIALTNEALELLRLSPRGSRWVAPSMRTRKPYTDIRKPLGRVCEAAGIVLTPHWLRHTFGAAAAESGLTAKQISALLGQKSEASAERYSHLDNESQRIAARRVGARSIGRAA